jgi:hypothetical protein
MSADIIDFRSASERRVSAAHVEPAEPFVPRVTGRQRAGRKRNPLRHPYQQMELAITAAGKLHREKRCAGRIMSTTLHTSAEALRPHDSSLRSLSGSLRSMAGEHRQ